MEMGGVNVTIEIGLAGWGDHDDLYETGTKPGDKLKVYGEHFPVVEVDSTFYAIQSRDRFAKWVENTRDSLQFVVKAYGGMTGHQRGGSGKQENGDMAEAFKRMLEPAIHSGRLTAVLFQYPPWFDCNSHHVKLLKYTKQRMEGIPCALEFRHQSWFHGEMRERTLAFMEEEGWIHSVCDEPQAGTGSIPTVLQATTPDVTILRMHGRNVSGWNAASAPNWREVRYLYRYNEAELMEWRDKLIELEQQCRRVCVIFNNNSGGDAARNAKEMMQLLGQKRPDGSDPIPEPSPPDVEQLELF
ncbi:DUF72 domain-containing protein [Paenibacillus chungangensis]|uniref:DUF72 domain-containing protein n=1 Tax=Paenibacillus chungangensis TaxID=696535 RepID=A0ABW3HSF5_9BACL